MPSTYWIHSKGIRIAAEHFVICRIRVRIQVESCDFLKIEIFTIMDTKKMITALGHSKIGFFFQLPDANSPR